MYLDCIIPIPEAKGLISVHHQKKMTVVSYKVERVYNPKTQMSEPKRVMIGKVVDEEKRLMVPNENFSKYFPDIPLDTAKEEPAERSSAIKAGTFLLYEKIIQDLQLHKLTKKHFGDDTGLMFDLVSYMITCESNVAQHYPDYAFNHPLWTAGMQIKSDSTVSRLLQNISKDQIMAWLDDWNALRGPQERVYISYDSTNKNSQSGDIDLVEFGHPKEDKGLPIFNTAIAYDQDNRMPLWYDVYPGSLNDVSQLTSVIDQMREYNYRHIGIILDRGFVSRKNIEYMDQHGFNFLIMMKGPKQAAATVINQVRGSFENDFDSYIEAYKVYATTIRHTLYEGDAELRYFHVCYDEEKRFKERRKLEEDVTALRKLLEQRIGTHWTLDAVCSHYFSPTYSTLEDSPNRVLLGVTPKKDVIARELELCGYFCLISSEEMTARDAVHLYKGRDATEKLFMMMKTFLGSDSERVHSAEALEAKVFLEFIGLIIRNRIYNLLKEHMQRLNLKKNFLTVPAAIRELDKLELVLHNGGSYRQAYAVTKNQREIFQAVGLSEDEVKCRAQNVAQRLTDGTSPEQADAEEDFE